MVGINRFEGKDKRRARRRNFAAKDLRSPKYQQRIVTDRKRRESLGGYYFDEEYYSDLDPEFGV